MEFIDSIWFTVSLGVLGFIYLFIWIEK